MKGFLRKSVYGLLKTKGYKLNQERLCYWTHFPSGIKVIKVKIKDLKPEQKFFVDFRLGAYWPSVEALVHGGGFHMVRPPPFGCTISLSLSHIATNKSIGWIYNEETEKEVCDKAIHLLTTKGFAWLEKCETPHGLLEELIAVNSKERILALRKLLKI